MWVNSERRDSIKLNTTVRVMCIVKTGVIGLILYYSEWIIYGKRLHSFWFFWFFYASSFVHFDTEITENS